MGNADPRFCRRNVLVLDCANGHQKEDQKKVDQSQTEEICPQEDAGKKEQSSEEAGEEKICGEDRRKQEGVA